MHDEQLPSKEPAATDDGMSKARSGAQRASAPARRALNAIRHGHTDPASIANWRTSLGSSVIANVTGSVVVELVPPAEIQAPTAAA